MFNKKKEIKIATLLLIGTLLVSTIPAMAIQPDGSQDGWYGQTMPWPKFHRFLNNTGYIEGQGTITEPVLKWNYTTGNLILSSPAVADVDGDGNLDVVVGSYDNNIYCLNGADGTLKWSYTTGGGVYSSPAVADVDGDGNLDVVVGSMDKNVYCLNGADGTLKWSYTTGGGVYSSPAVADVDGDGNLDVVVGSYDNNIYCLNGTDGTLKWIYTTGDQVFLSSPAVADVDGDGNLDVVVGSRDKNVYCLNGADGTLKWSYTTGDWIDSSPAVADVDGDGNLDVVVGSRDKNVYCLNGTDGTFKWSYTTGDQVWSHPAVADVDGDGNLDVVVGSRDKNVYCLNGADGTFKWSYTLGGYVYSAPAVADVDGDGNLDVVVGSKDDLNLYCLNGADGALKWSFTTGGWLWMSFAAVADIDGDDELEIMFGSWDHKVYCLDGPTAPDLTPTAITTPASIIATQSNSIEATIANIGSGNAGSFNVSLSADGTPVDTASVDSLTAGASTTVSFSWTPASAGGYELCVVADSDGAVDESDETNNGLCEGVTVERPVIPVDIDVKPGSCPNPLNLKSKGVLPVAVLGTAEFDVTTIDPGTILVIREGCEGVAAPIRWSYEDVATPFTGELCDCHDLNGDGYIDMTLKFDTQELVSNLKLDEAAGETVPLAVTGDLKAENGGTPIEGKDCIRV